MGSRYNDKIDSSKKMLDELKSMRVDFINQNEFRAFLNALQGEGIYAFLQGVSDRDDQQCLDISGYIDAGIYPALDEACRGGLKIRILTPTFERGGKMGRSQVATLAKLEKCGVEIKVSDNIHARMFHRYTNIAGTQFEPKQLILGSFDLNSDAYIARRFDAGIRTTNYDLGLAAVHFFNICWNDEENKTFSEWNKS